MAVSLSLAASFRDPGGFVFKFEGEIYRSINQSFAADYEQLMTSGLYARLVNDGLLIPHQEIDDIHVRALCPNAYKILKPSPVPFISYAYEWCFGQLREAALTTLSIARAALEFDMVLKDSPSRNIQFWRGKAVQIDTLSFERYKEDQPWLAYRQFCEHFLVPLALMSKIDMRSNCWLKSYTDGFPIDLAAKMMGLRHILNPWLAVHLYLHANLQTPSRGGQGVKAPRRISKKEVRRLIDSLEAAVTSLECKLQRSVWSDYYVNNTYSEIANKSKHQIVAEFLWRCSPDLIWDLGANNGDYARFANPNKAYCVAIEQDPNCVEQNYRTCVANGETHILPLVGNISDPNPGLGWNNSECDGLISRGPADCILALGLVHHLVIAHGAPLTKVAATFAQTGRNAVVEFIPSDDAQVKCMLASRQVRENPYAFTRAQFESAFGENFTIIASSPIEDSERHLYLLKTK